MMMDDDFIEFDLSKVLIAEFLDVLVNPDLVKWLKFVDKASVGGIMDKSMDELPQIMARLQKVMIDNSEDIIIAMGSMKKYLDGSDD